MLCIQHMYHRLGCLCLVPASHTNLEGATLHLHNASVYVTYT